MKVLLLGAGGQLGRELTRTCPKHVSLEPYDYPHVNFLVPASIQTCIKKTSPDQIINAAAYTAVDLAEEEPEKAYRLNHLAVAEIAAHARKAGIGLTHISTDYVFSGRHYKPWLPQDTPAPLSVYGHSKHKGEKAIQAVFQDRALIIRTAWLYASHGKNFVKTMLSLMSQGKDLTVIDEQIGTPTWANGLAKCIWTCIEKDIRGLHHWADAGTASWYDFAVAIQEEALALDLIQTPVSITPVSSDRYPTVADRPYYSILDKRSLCKATDIPMVHWREQLREMLKEIKHPF